jgi:hypothetical protein
LTVMTIQEGASVNDLNFVLNVVKDLDAR